MDSTKNIFGFNVKYDSGSESVKHALHFFEELGESGTKALFNEARRDTVNHTSHFEVHSHSSSNVYHLTIVDEGDGTYHLRKRTGY